MFLYPLDYLIYLNMLSLFSNNELHPENFGLKFNVKYIDYSSRIHKFQHMFNVVLNQNT